MPKFKLKYIVLSLCAMLSICSGVQAYEWTGWTSEEYGPKVCDFDKFQSGFKCSGSYCDWVAMECHDPGIDHYTNRRWIAQVSEESGGLRYCPWGEFISGVSTSGKYSDNISLECADAVGVNWNACYWTSWVSEEGSGTLLFPGGYYGVGMQCHGSYCDSKRFYICRTH